jgi:hypothetical protein
LLAKKRSVLVVDDDDTANCVVVMSWADQTVEKDVDTKNDSGPVDERSRLVGGNCEKRPVKCMCA